MEATLQQQARNQFIGTGRGLLPSLCLCGLAATTLSLAHAQDTGSLPTRPAAPTVVAVTSRSVEPGSLALASDGRTTNQLAGVGYRWWSSHGNSDIGIGLGTLGRVVLPPPGPPGDMSMLSRSVPSMTVGWRYRTSNSSAVYADASRARLPGIEEPMQYNAKLGMEWRSAKPKRVGFEPGSLGVHFDSGYRMSVRLRSGGVKMVLRSQF